MRDSTITLTKPIAAVQAAACEEGRTRLGLVSQLPPGAEIEVCGDGLTDRTVKVCWKNQFYFVFCQDLDTMRNAVAPVSRLAV